MTEGGEHYTMIKLDVLKINSNGNVIYFNG
jgi:hypothetical protein